jgi:hypothetical protein
MTNPVAVLREVWFTPEGSTESRLGYKEVRVWCPGCKQAHPFRVWVDPEMPERPAGGAYPTWSWNGSLESPSFEPSLLCYTSVHLCEGEHDILSLRCDKEFEECGHKGHGYGWILPDGTVRQYKVYEYDQIPEGTVQFTFGGSSPHPREPAWGNCHTFLRNGVWEFLSDCGHSLRGMVPLEPLPDWYMKDEDGYTG